MTPQEIFFAGIPATVLVHESGHLLAAWLLRFSPRLVNIGVGAIIVTGRYGFTRFTLRVLPLNGYVTVLPIEGDRRWAWGAVIVAGILANITAILGLGVASVWCPHASPMLAALAGSQALAAFIALVPGPAKVNGIDRSTDGLQLLRILGGTRPESFERMYLQYIESAWSGQPKPDHPSPGARELLYWHGKFKADIDRLTARDIVRSLHMLLLSDRLNEPETFIPLDVLLSIELVLQTNLLKARDLEAFVDHAVAMSDRPTTRVTKGGVLASLGRFDEAEAFLRPLVAEPMNIEASVAARMFLAQAYRGLGKDADAKAWMQEAKALVPPEGNRMLEWLIREFRHGAGLTKLDH